MSYGLGMPLQRALLLFFAVMLVSAAAASLVRAPQLPTGTDPEPATTNTEETRTARESPRTHDAAEARSTDADALDLTVGDSPATSTFAPDRHLILTVNSAKPGQITVPGLGLVASVVRRTPAVFDLFTHRAGEFPIEFTPAGDETAVLVGTLVVEKGS